MEVYHLKKLVVGSIGILLTGSQMASAILISFDDPVQTNESASGEIWGVDRYAPSGFESEEFLGDNRLKITISTDDSAENRPADFQGAFFNTQGYKYTLDDGASTASGDLYLNPEWADLTQDFRVGLWGNAVDDNGNVTEFPIISFGTDGGSDDDPFVFRYFSGADGGWTVLGGLDDFGVELGDWVNLGFEINGEGTTTHFINGVEVGVDDGGYGTTELDELILQSGNRGEDYTVYWDNVASSVVAVPEPSVSILCGGGLLLLLGRRRA